MASSKTKKSSQPKKGKIIERTKGLLLRKGGSKSVSTSDVCAAANLARSSLYHYFGSKTNLMLSVHFSFIEKTIKPYLTEAAAINDPFERLKFMVRTFTSDKICRHPELRLLIHDELVMKDKHFREVKAEYKKHYLLLRNTIAELQSRGMVSRDVKASWAALFVLGMLSWITYWFDYQRKGQIAAMGDAALRMVLYGLNPVSHPPPSK
jgi:TetR/AcrR family transcriptional regulator, cholesterol catabolism regulator